MQDLLQILNRYWMPNNLCFKMSYSLILLASENFNPQLNKSVAEISVQIFMNFVF
jgi:hypothetical protein